MTVKELNRDDLLNRNPGFTFDETIIDSETLVEFLDLGLDIVTSYQNQSVDVCYKKIREKEVGDDTILHWLTTAERDALTSTVEFQKIYNITNKQTEVYNGSFWQPIGSLRAFGSMFEDNATGSAIANTGTYQGWVTATVGQVDNLGLVTFVNNATADRLTIGAGGEGRYFVAFNASFTGTSGQVTTGAIHLNNVEQGNIKASSLGSTNNPEMLMASNYLNLSETDFIDLRFESTLNITVDVFNVSVAVFRVGI